MKKIIVVAFVATSLLLTSACGNITRSVAGITGHSEVCVSGVTYLQFPSGVTVKVDREGKPVPC